MVKNDRVRHADGFLKFTFLTIGYQERVEVIAKINAAQKGEGYYIMRHRKEKSAVSS